MTAEDIRNDLKEIRIYYSMKKTFEMGERYAGQSMLTEKVKKYNAAILSAPGKMYVLYVNLYVCNNSQETLAVDWGYTANYVKDMNNQFIAYFIEKFRSEKVG